MEEIARTLAAAEMPALVWAPVIPIMAGRPENNGDVSKNKVASAKTPGRKSLTKSMDACSIRNASKSRDISKVTDANSSKNVSKPRTSAITRTAKTLAKQNNMPLEQQGHQQQKGTQQQQIRKQQCG
jgi:hypothetical protein